MIYDCAYDVVLDDVFLRLPGLLDGVQCFLKLEGFNPAGSVKIKTAVALVEDLESRGLLRPGGRIAESSSGSLGIALSVVCAIKKYSFTCVVDPNTSPRSVATMRSLGARVVMVSQRDGNGGYLGTRIAALRSMLSEDSQLVWTNQYANSANPRAHWTRTAGAILTEFQAVDYLVVGAGTTGTLMGCAAYFRQFSPRTRIIAVDSVGSVTFGHPAGPRHIPGVGTSRVPELCRPDLVDEVVMVEEAQAVRACRQLATGYGLLAGGSTGSVVAALGLLAGRIPADAKVVAIAPDMGERYLDTVYDDAWVAERFPDLNQAGDAGGSALALIPG
jgi:cysteine synthase A